MIALKTRRPFGVTLLAWMEFLVAIFNLLRLVLTLCNWDFLVGLLPISPAYLAVTGLVWFLIGLPITWGTWRGKEWAPRFILVVFFIYSFYYWADRLLTPGYPGRNLDWPFAVTLNLLILLLGVWILSRRKAKTFFGEVHEREN